MENLAQELRIGNLVKSGNGIYKIFALSAPQILVIQDYLEPDGSQRKVYPTDGTIIKPIPLTEEWLERGGFETILWKQDGIVKEVSISRDGVSLNENYCLHGIEDMKPINYVHQLQNLFYALTQTELTFKA